MLADIIDHDVIFIDPPWGGKCYKDHRKLRLQISGIPIETLCTQLFNKIKMKKVPYMIILKLPRNYDIEYLYNNIKNCQIYLHKLDKMDIIVIVHDR